MYNLGGYQIMTKKNIWVKLLIVALIIAMVGAFFIACDNNEKDPTDDGKKPDGEGNEDNNTEEAVNALLGVIDDAIAALGGIDNVGNLGTDAYIDLAIEQEGVTKKIRVDLDLSLDLLNSESGGDGYINNGFGFAISVDDGDGVLDRVFGAWYVDELEDKDNYVYLSAGGQNFKIDALTLASVLEKYNVNANVEVGSKLQAIGSLAENPNVASFLALLPDLGINIGYEKVGNQEVFSLNIKELFNPSEDNAIGETLDEMIFQSPELAGILSSLNIAISSVGDVYNMIPNIDLEIIGNYNAAGTFESIGLGLAVDGKSDGITIPTTDGKGMTIIEGSFPDTNLSATLGFKILSSNDAYDNVKAVRDEAIADTTWNEIGVLNFAFEGTVTLGQTKETANTYSIELSADINAAKLATVDFTRRVYYKDAAGNYVKDAEGNYVYTDWFYMNGASDVFGGSLSPDVINTFLTSINNLYLKIQNTKNADDIMVVALTTPFSSTDGSTVNGGNVFIKLNALNNIMSAFGLDLRELLGDFADTILGLEGNVPVGDLMGAVNGILPGLIYKIPENYAALGAVAFEPVAPTGEEAKAVTFAEAAAGTEGSGDDVMTVIMEVIDKIKKCVKFDTAAGSITAAGSGADYSIGGATLDFNMAAALLKDGEGVVNGVKVDVNKFIANYKEGEVVTSVNGNVKVGGDNNLFSAEVTVNQTKKADAENPLNIYIALDVAKIGYGCAPTSPVAIEIASDGKTFVQRTGDIFVENVGWVASK